MATKRLGDLAKVAEGLGVMLMVKKNRVVSLASALLALLAMTACAGTPTLLPKAVTGDPDAFSIDAAEGVEPQPEAMPGRVIVVPPAPTRSAPVPRPGNAVKAFVSPAETLPAVLDLIDGAQKSIYLETFNFGNDSYGQRIVPRLIAKAQAGIEVKVVMDYVGSRFLGGHGAMVKALKKGGVDVRRYFPRGIKKDDGVVGINIQHRKVYLADGERALVGGVNLMREFDTINQDVLVLFQGPVVADLYREFAHDYRATGGKKPVLLPATAEAVGESQAQVVVTSPDEGRFEGRNAIYAAIEMAQQTIEIENQYLWDDHLMARLLAALGRGVKVRVMVPGEEHKQIFKNIHAEELKRLVDKGGEARTYHGQPEDAHLHVKYYNIDNRWTAIGSTNGDTRALMDNQELQMVITDPTFSVNLRERLFEHDWAERSKPFVYKPGSVVSRPFRSLLEIIDYYL